MKLLVRRFPTRIGDDCAISAVVMRRAILAWAFTPATEANHSSI